ncbi:phospholipase D family protein [Vandammella animalimorsus]|uniref:DNA repair protein n=1 Tax=Vandammella animalimorsus TaxID=2029117 RepID=A0A2A2ABS5_9BURK|nr:phospholipase D family protein [Vandammella animalimorsus]PAT35227.1 DNA repair protein [Vandammella animalimorsus]
MAKFLNTSATNYFLEELIKNARERVILISPFLKLNDRIKELLADKNRLKIDVRIVYGKSELQPEEIAWLNALTYVRTSFCKNLHAKCYLNEENCIVTSLNLYEFSQVNNNEMGVLFRKSEDHELYRDAYEEAQRIIRISEEVRISMERVPAHEADGGGVEEEEEAASNKLTSSRLAAKHKLKTTQLLDRLVQSGHLEIKGDKHHLTEKGKQAGGEFKFSKKFGAYFLWPEDLALD